MGTRAMVKGSVLQKMYHKMVVKLIPRNSYSLQMCRLKMLSLVNLLMHRELGIGQNGIFNWHKKLDMQYHTQHLRFIRTTVA